MRKKPEWVKYCEYDVFMRMEIMRMVIRFDDTLRVVYGLSHEQEELMNKILIWFMDKGTPQNTDSLAKMVHRSWGKVQADLEHLYDRGVVIKIGNKIYPSSHFVIGSDTSGQELESTVQTVENVKEQIRQRDENAKEFQERMEIMESRLQVLRDIESTL